jgi:plastocyanin
MSSRRLSTRLVRVGALGAAAVLAFAACSGNDVETGKIKGVAGGTPKAGAQPLRVQARNFSFDPDTLQVTAGEEIALRLQSEDSSHDFAIDGLGTVADVSGGETTTARLRIDEPGKYTYFCTVPGHRDGGMEGTITVTKP